MQSPSEDSLSIKDALPLKSKFSIRLPTLLSYSLEEPMREGKPQIVRKSVAYSRSPQPHHVDPLSTSPSWADAGGHQISPRRVHGPRTVPAFQRQHRLQPRGQQSTAQATGRRISWPCNLSQRIPLHQGSFSPSHLRVLTATSTGKAKGPWQRSPFTNCSRQPCFTFQ